LKLFIFRIEERLGAMNEKRSRPQARAQGLIGLTLSLT